VSITACFKRLAPRPYIIDPFPINAGIFLIFAPIGRLGNSSWNALCTITDGGFGSGLSRASSLLFLACDDPGRDAASSARFTCSVLPSKWQPVGSRVE
jgi:hypothetical protein